MSWELRRFLESFLKAGKSTLEDVRKWLDSWSDMSALPDAIRDRIYPGHMWFRFDPTPLIREFTAYHDDCDQGALIEDILRMEEN